MGTKRSRQSPGRTKADLVQAVYRRHGGITKSEAAGIVERVLDTVRTSLLDGRTVKIKNFGTFEVTERPARWGVSPASGVRIEIPEQRGLSFRPARHLRDVVSHVGVDPAGGRASKPPKPPKSPKSPKSPKIRTPSS